MKTFDDYPALLWALFNGKLSDGDAYIFWLLTFAAIGAFVVGWMAFEVMRRLYVGLGRVSERSTKR